MADDVQIVVGIKGDVSGGRVIQKSLDDIATSSEKAVTATEKLDKAIGKTTVTTNSFDRAVNAAKKPLDDISGAVDKATASTSRLDRATDKTVSATNRLDRATVGIKKPLDDIASSGDKAVSATKRLEAQSKATALAGDALGRAFAAAGALFGAAQLVKMADGYRLLESRVKSIAGSVQETGRVMGELRKISDQTGSSMEASVSILQRLSFSRNEIKATNDEMLAFTETVTKLGIMSGASGESLKAGLTQLGQALSSDILRAEEFNSVMENTPGIGKAIADQLGVSTGQLRLLVVNGQVLRDDIFAAILNITKLTREQFEEFPKTAEQGFNQMLGRVTQVADEINKATDGTNLLGGAFRAIGEAIKRVYDGISAAFSYAVAGISEAINLILIGFNKALQGVDAVKKSLPTWAGNDGKTLEKFNTVDPGAILKEANAEATARNSRLFADDTKDIEVGTRKISKNYADIASKLGTSTKLTKEQREALKAQKELQHQLTDAIKDSRSETEQLYDKIAEMEKLRPFAKTKEQAEAITKNIRNAQDELEKLRVKAELQSPTATAFASLASEIDDGFKDAFKSAFTASDGGFKKLLEGWKNTFKSFLADLAYQALVRPIAVSLVGGIGGSMGLSTNAVASVLGQVTGAPGIAGGGTGGGFSLTSLSGLMGKGLGGATGSAGNFIGTSVGKLMGMDEYASLAMGDKFGNFLSNAGSWANVGGGFAGSFLAGKLGLGNKNGYVNAAAGTAGALIGQALIPVPFLGAALGSFAGSAIGGLFGNKKPSDKSQWGSIDFATLAQTAGGLGGKKYSAQNAGVRDTIIGQIAGVLGLVKEYGGSASGSAQITVGNRDGLRYNGRNFGRDATGFNTAIFGDLRSSITGLDKTFTTILDKLGVTSSVDTLTQAFAFGKQYNETLAAARPAADTLADSIKALDDNMKALLATATSLGLPIDDYTKALQKQKDAAVGALKAQAAGFNSLTDMTNAFKGFLDGQALGSNSSLSPTDKLRLSQDNFGGLLAKAQGGDLSVTQDLLKAANELLDIGRGVYASSVSFAGLETFVRQSVTGVAKQAGVPGYDSTADAGLEMVKLNTQLNGSMSEAVDLLKSIYAEAIRTRKLQESTRNQQAVVG